MSKQYTIPSEHVETVENAIDAVDELEDVCVDRTRGQAAGNCISTGEAIAKICEAYSGWSE